MTPSATFVEDLDRNWDLVVIGGGTAGLIATRIAASLGADVLMVERAREPGGDCLWTGCVPSKALIAAARSVHTARTSPFVSPRQASDVDFVAVMRHVNDAMRTIAPEDSVEVLQRDGVAVLQGSAVFTDQTSLGVDGRKIRFRQAIIATGARPRELDVEVRTPSKR